MKLSTLSPRTRLLTQIFAVVGIALVLSFTASAQTAAGEKPKMGPGDALPDKVEISGFGGGSFFQQTQNASSGFGTKLNNGGAFGFRVTENFWKYVGVEQAFTYSVNNVTFLQPTAPGQANFGFGNRVYQYSLNPVFYFTERGSKIRPFVTIGPSAFDFAPTSAAKDYAQSPAAAQYGAKGLNSVIEVGMNYGGGVKIHLNDHWGLRIDARGLWSRNPTFKLPSGPGSGGVWIDSPQSLNGVQTTAGITYYIGKKAQPLPAPAPPPPPQPLASLTAGMLSAGSGTLCQGRAITVRSNATDPAGRTLTYKWKVNGQPAGSNSPELSFTPDKPGSYMVELEVTAPNNENLPVRVASANTLSLNVQEYKAPTATSCSANPAAIKYGQTSALNALGTGSACSSIAFAWTATEGTISNNTSANPTFDSKSVRFEQGGKIQSKTVTATAKVTDDRGASASCSTTVKVDYIPDAIRFSDIVFSKGSSRVNNCGKRILLEEVAPKAADTDYEIVLIGHMDPDEVSKTKSKATPLDELRVLNAVGVLTGGTGTCANVDKSRIKADWVAIEQDSDMQPGLCGTSTRASTKERNASAVSTADQNRRVEVWLVPKGVTLPKGFKSAKELPEKELKKIGCPK